LFPQVFPAYRTSSDGRIAKANPKKWENPEISTAPGPRRRKLKSSLSRLLFMVR
jgi:hypothetical protein